MPTKTRAVLTTFHSDDFHYIDTNPRITRFFGLSQQLSLMHSTPSLHFQCRLYDLCSNTSRYKGFPVATTQPVKRRDTSPTNLNASIRTRK